jgi:hypothetical protein
VNEQDAQNAQGTYEPQQQPTGPPPGASEPPRQRDWGRQGYARDSSYGFDPRSKNAALACFLSLMPGLGQVYVGFYQRGFLHILIVGSTIALLAEEPVRELTPLLGIFLPFFWLYNIIDAGRRAGLYNHALQAGGAADLPAELPALKSGGSVGGGLILIVLGTALLLYTRFGVSLDWLEEWWPIAPIGVGVWLVAKGVQGRLGDLGRD